MRTNHCLLIGNLGADPVERGRSEKAGPIVGFSLAENVNSLDRESGRYKTVHTNWFQVTAFGSMAERAKRSLKKGDRVAIQGRIQTTKYQTKSGEEKSGFEIIAEDIALYQALPSSARNDESAASGRRPESREASPVNEEALPF